MKRTIPIVLWIGVFVLGGLMFWYNTRPKPGNQEFIAKHGNVGSVKNKDGELVVNSPFSDGRTFVDVPWKHLPSIKPFRLSDQSGEKFDSREIAGKPYVVSFFFAGCPTICRKLNGKIQGLADEFDDEELKFVSVTCNPKDDTPEVLNRYAESLDADIDQWKFLTDQFYRIQEVGRQFDVILDLNTHTDDILLVDRWGKYRDRFDYDDPREIERFKKVAKEVLAETEPPMDSTVSTRNALAGIPHDQKRKSWLDEFFLQDHNGDEFYSRDLTGDVWIGSMFFTTCPGICKKQNEYILSLQDRLGDRPVNLVSITTNPEIDTPSVLATYRRTLGIKNDNWTFLTGEPTYIRRISEEFFGVPLSNTEHHSSKLFVVDRWGNVRESFDWQEEGAEAQLMDLVDRLLKEKTPGDRFADETEIENESSNDSSDLESELP